MQLPRSWSMGETAATCCVHIRLVTFGICLLRYDVEAADNWAKQGQPWPPLAVDMFMDFAANSYLASHSEMRPLFMAPSAFELSFDKIRKFHQTAWMSLAWSLVVSDS